MTGCIGVRLLRMGFVSLTCPKCGAPVELDESREYGFCQFCGTKITQEKVVVEHRGSVAVNHAEEISNCLRRAEDLYQRGSTLEAEFYYDRVLSMDPENPLAKSRMEALYRIIRDPNVTVELEIGRFFNKNTALTIRIDKKDCGQVSCNNERAFTSPVGQHMVYIGIAGVLFSSKKFAIDIKDRFTRYNFHVKVGVGGSMKVLCQSNQEQPKTLGIDRI